jgi:hypothetical protein
MELVNFCLKHSRFGTTFPGLYSGRRITLSFSYVTERGEGKMKRARKSKTAKSLV